MPIFMCQQKEKTSLSQNFQISISHSIFEILVLILACDLYVPGNKWSIFIIKTENNQI